ncbi:MAG: ATP-binding cassette domain-containing protein, partial [Clostridiales bacterium]
FLNEVVNVVYHVENSSMTRYTGNYEQFMSLYEIKKRQLEQAYEKQQNEIDQLEDFVARNKARAATATLARSRQKKLDKMEIIEIGKEKAKPSFCFIPARTSAREVIVAENLVLGYDEALTRPVDVTVERYQKIAICGVNGLGKTTLLKTLLGLIAPFDGMVKLGQFTEVGYFEQEERGNDLTAMEEIWQAFPGMSNGEVRGALARCGLTSEHIGTQMRVLSGGENAKVRLCKLMLQPMNLLVLDEPTNHLDIDAKAALTEALRDYRGTVLLVSHEPEFYQEIATIVWNVEDWTTKVI